MGCRQVGKARGFEPRIRRFESYHPRFAGVVELVDTRGLEPRASCVRVQVPPPADETLKD